MKTELNKTPEGLLCRAGWRKHFCEFMPPPCNEARAVFFIKVRIEYIIIVKFELMRVNNRLSCTSGLIYILVSSGERIMPCA